MSLQGIILHRVAKSQNEVSFLCFKKEFEASEEIQRKRFGNSRTLTTHESLYSSLHKPTALKSISCSGPCFCVHQELDSQLRSYYSTTEQKLPKCKLQQNSTNWFAFEGNFRQKWLSSRHTFLRSLYLIFNLPIFFLRGLETGHFCKRSLNICVVNTQMFKTFILFHLRLLVKLYFGYWQKIPGQKRTKARSISK